MDFAKSLWDLEIHDQSHMGRMLSCTDMLPKCGGGAARTVEREGERITKLLVLSKGAREKKRGTPNRPPLSPHRVPPPDLLALCPCILASPLSHPFFLINFQSIHTVRSST